MRAGISSALRPAIHDVKRRNVLRKLAALQPDGVSRKSRSARCDVPGERTDERTRVIGELTRIYS